MVQYMLVRGSAQSRVYTVGRCEIYISLSIIFCLYVCLLQHIQYTFLLLRRYSFNVLDESAFHHSLIKGTPVRDGFMANPLYSIIGIFQQMRMTFEGHLQMCWVRILYKCLWRKKINFIFSFLAENSKNAKMHSTSSPLIDWNRHPISLLYFGPPKIRPFHPTLFRRMAKNRLTLLSFNVICAFARVVVIEFLLTLSVVLKNWLEMPELLTNYLSSLCKIYVWEYTM